MYDIACVPRLWYSKFGEGAPKNKFAQKRKREEKKLSDMKYALFMAAPAGSDRSCCLHIYFSKFQQKSQVFFYTVEKNLEILWKLHKKYGQKLISRRDWTVKTAVKLGFFDDFARRLKLKKKFFWKIKGKTENFFVKERKKIQLLYDKFFRYCDGESFSFLLKARIKVPLSANPHFWEISSKDEYIGYAFKKGRELFWLRKRQETLWKWAASFFYFYE